MQAGVLCETVRYASIRVRECVSECGNSHSKSKSLTAALMPAASQVMKGPLLVATDTSITPPPVDSQSITLSTQHSVSLTLACIIKVYPPDLPAQLLPAASCNCHHRRRRQIRNGHPYFTSQSVRGETRRQRGHAPQHRASHLSVTTIDP